MYNRKSFVYGYISLQSCAYSCYCLICILDWYLDIYIYVIQTHDIQTDILILMREQVYGLSHGHKLQSKYLCIYIYICVCVGVLIDVSIIFFAMSFFCSCLLFSWVAQVVPLFYLYISRHVFLFDLFICIVESRLCFCFKSFVSFFTNSVS